MKHATTDAPRIDRALTINEIVARYPQTIPVFNRFGLDTCCGGGVCCDKTSVCGRLLPSPSSALLPAALKPGASSPGPSSVCCPAAARCQVGGESGCCAPGLTCVSGQCTAGQ